MSNLAPFLYSFSALNSENIQILHKMCLSTAVELLLLQHPCPPHSKPADLQPPYPLAEHSYGGSHTYLFKAQKKGRPLQKIILLLPFPFVSISRRKASHCLGACASDPGWLNTRLSWLSPQILPRHWCFYCAHKRINCLPCHCVISQLPCLGTGSSYKTCQKSVSLGCITQLLNMIESSAVIQRLFLTAFWNHILTLI